MDNLRHLLPSAGNLIVFEAAGRQLSFTKAAKELGMTQAAVSYAIRSLESQLGTALFHRAHRAVTLNEAVSQCLRLAALVQKRRGRRRQGAPWAGHQ